MEYAFKVPARLVSVLILLDHEFWTHGGMEKEHTFFFFFLQFKPFVLRSGWLTEKKAKDVGCFIPTHSNQCEHLGPHSSSGSANVYVTSFWFFPLLWPWCIALWKKAHMWLAECSDCTNHSGQEWFNGMIRPRLSTLPGLLQCRPIVAD